MDRFSERMLKLIQDNNITYEELETKTGIPRSTLQRYATGTNKKIPIDRVKTIATALDTSAAFLIGWESNTNIAEKEPLKSPLYHIPIIGCVKAGFDGIAFEEPLGYTIESVPNPQDYFALKVFGDSMEPHIYAGDIALVKMQSDVENNDLAVVIINGDCGMIKKVIKTNGTIMLQSFNSSYLPILISGDNVNEFHIVGKVIETKKRW